MTTVSLEQNRYPPWVFRTTALSLPVLLFFPAVMRGRTEGMLHPRGSCYVWDSQLVFWHVSMDLAIGLAYVAISATLAYFVWNGRRLIPFHWMFLAFGVFILACGSIHFMEVWTVWYADFWGSAAVKIVTAVASVSTAIALPPLIPQALSLVQAARVSEERRIELDAAREQLAVLNALKRSEEERKQLLEREREARTRAEEASRAKDEFLANLSHELRTPANAIVGWAQMLHTGRLADPNAIKQAAESIYRNAHLQARLVDDLLDLTRSATGALRIESSPVDLHTVVEQAAETVGHAARSRQVTIQVDVPSSPVVIAGDAGRLQQIVWNLLSNAVKFTPANGHVYVSVSKKPDEATIAVADTGIGIAPDFLPYLFDRFTQADATSTRAAGGLGIGLAIARQLTELHGGRITVHSGGSGRGTTFTVHLPVSP